MYELIHTQMFSPLSLMRFSMPAGSGNTLLSHRKSLQWNSFIQKQSK